MLDFARTMIVTVAAQKGGVGKSKTCQILAIEALNAKFKAAIVDLDPQETTLKWSHRRSVGIPAVLSAKVKGLKPQIDTLTQAGAEIIIIDTPPHARPLINQAIAAADLVVIPTEPFVESLEAVAETVAIVRENGKPSIMFLNKVPATGGKGISMAVRTPLAAAYGIPLAGFDLVYRAPHYHSGVKGLTTAEMNPNSPADQEGKLLWNWVYKNLKEQVNGTPKR